MAATTKKTVKKTATTAKAVKTVKKPATKPVEKTTTKKVTKGKIGRINNQLKASKLTLALTIIGIFACAVCVIMDVLNGYYDNMPMYAILLFIIIVEDKK